MSINTNKFELCISQGLFVKGQRIRRYYSFIPWGAGCESAMQIALHLNRTEELGQPETHGNDLVLLKVCLLIRRRGRTG